MDRTEIKELLREVIGPNAPTVDHSKWVGMCCPLAEWRHAGGRDSSPSSGISVKDGGTSIFHCWSCGAKGTVPWLLRQLERYTGENYASLIRGIEDGEFLGGSLPEWGARVRRHAEDKFVPVTYLDLYDSAEGHWYLRDRGIAKHTAKELRLLVDPEDAHGAERILFPVMDRQGRLHGITGRAVLNDIEPRIRDYHGLQKAHSLLGLHKVEADAPFVVLVEGLFDYAMVWQYGYNVVATMHAGVTAIQANKLRELGLPVVLMFDSDQAGITATELATKALLPYLPLSVVKYPRRVVPRGGKKKCPKDPATCTMEEVQDMIEKAKIV